MPLFTLHHPITPELIAHIVCGGVAICAGAVALVAPKGERVLRAAGTLFFLSMLVMSASGAYFALALPGAAAFPRMGTAIVGGLTFNLVLSAWMTVRRPAGAIGLFEMISMTCNLAAALILCVMASLAVTSADGLFDGINETPYLLAALLAGVLTAFDISVIRRGGVSGRSRIARHLWRMCFALFLANAFFFIGQQKTMPPDVRGATVLTLIALSPLAFMIFWLLRTRLAKQA